MIMPGSIARTARLITVAAILQELSGVCLLCRGRVGYGDPWPERYTIPLVTVQLRAAFDYADGVLVSGVAV